MEDNYKEIIENYLSLMHEALKREDYQVYGVVRDMIDETISDRVHALDLMNEADTTNFGVLNHIFRAELPRLLRENRKAVRDVIRTIKGDSNLLAEFRFYNAVTEGYRGKGAELMTAEEAFDSISEAVIPMIDKDTVSESNAKLRKVMMDCGVIPSDFVSEDAKELYGFGNILLTEKGTVGNIYKFAESRKAICEYMESHKGDGVAEYIDVDEEVRKFEESMSENLNESEISFVQQIVDFRSPIAEQRKERLLNSLRDDCIKKVTEMLKKDSDNEELNSIKNRLSEMKYSRECVIKDVANLLEIRDILSEE